MRSAWASARLFRMRQLAVDDLDGAVIIERQADAILSPHAFAEQFQPCLGDGVGAEDGVEPAQGADADIGEVVRIVVAARGAVPIAEPAERAGAGAGEHAAPLTGRQQQLIDAMTAPHIHHAQRVAAVHVDDLGLRHHAADFFRRRAVAKQGERLRLAAEALAIVRVEVGNLFGVIAAGRADEERARTLFPAQRDDLLVDGQVLALHHAPAADGHNCAHAVFPFRAAALNICS